MELFPQRHAVMQPVDLLRLDETARANVVRIDIVPPRLGRRDFGKVIATFRSPVLMPRLDDRRHG